jgi:hypothetical protein
VVDAAQSIAKAYDFEIRTIDEIAQSDEIQAVAICTPTNSHADLIEKIARREPLCFVKSGRSEPCKGKGVSQNRRGRGATLMVGFQRRFDPGFVALIQAASRLTFMLSAPKSADRCCCVRSFNIVNTGISPLLISSKSLTSFG